MKTLTEFLNESLMNEGKVSDFFGKIKEAAKKYLDEIKISKELSANLKKSKKLFLDALPNGSQEYDVLAIDKTMSKEFDKFWGSSIGITEGDIWTEYYILAKNSKKEVAKSVDRTDWSRTFKEQFINMNENDLEAIFTCYKIDGKLQSFGDESWTTYPKIALFDVTEARLNDSEDISEVIKALKENDADDQAFAVDGVISKLSERIK